MKVYAPCYNLGCLGFSIMDSIYFDFYKSWIGIGMFVKIGINRWTVNFNYKQHNLSIRKWR